MSGKLTRSKTAQNALSGGWVATVIPPTPSKRRVERFKGLLKGVWRARMSSFVDLTRFLWLLWVKGCLGNMRINQIKPNANMGY